MTKQTYEEKLEAQVDKLQEEFNTVWDLLLKVGTQSPRLLLDPKFILNIISIAEVIKYIKTDKRWKVKTTTHLGYQSYVCEYIPLRESGMGKTFEVVGEIGGVGKERSLLENKQTLEAVNLLKFLVDVKVAEGGSSQDTFLQFLFDIKSTKQEKKDAR